MCKMYNLWLTKLVLSIVKDKSMLNIILSSWKLVWKILISKCYFFDFHEKHQKINLKLIYEQIHIIDFISEKKLKYKSGVLNKAY